MLYARYLCHWILNLFQGWFLNLFYESNIHCHERSSTAGDAAFLCWNLRITLNLWTDNLVSFEMLIMCIFFASRYIMGMVRYVVLYSLNVIYSYLIAAAAKSVIKPPQTSGKQLLVFSKKSWCGSALFVIVRFKILNTEWGDSTLQNILKLLIVLEFWMENGERTSPKCLKHPVSKIERRALLSLLWC